MALEEELLAIRLELKGQSTAIAGLKEVDKAQAGVGTSTAAAGRAAEQAERKTLSLGTAYGKLSGHAKMALGFIGFGGVFALERAISNTEELAKTTSGLTRNFDLQTNVASRWGAVAYARDIDTKALNTTFTTLSKQFTTAAREGGKALLPFHQLGLTQEDAAKGAHNFEWGIMRVAKALGEEEGGAKRAAAAKALLGKGSATLLPLFSEGAKGLKENLKLSDEYGVTLNGKTTDGVMEMVNSQRELKMASLGIQIAMTKAAMPAIEATEDQVKEFIKTINDPDLTAEQKIHRIEHQFEGIENALIHIIEQALPGVAEHAGQLGIKVGEAVWHGFRESDVAGKLAIGAYVFSLFGGADVAKAGAKKVGARIGSEWTVGFGLGLTGALIGAEIWQHLSQQTKQEVTDWGLNAGQNFVNALIKVINLGIREINEVMDLSNVAAFAGVDAPNIGEIGEVDLTNPGGAQAPKSQPSWPGYNPEVPHGTMLPPSVATGGKHGKPRRGGRAGRRNMGSFEMSPEPRLRLGAFGGRPIVVESHSHLHVDGRELAEAVATATANSESLG